MPHHDPARHEWVESAEEHADEMEVAAMLEARGSDLSADGTYGDELAELLGLGVRVFLCHRVDGPRGEREGWHRYALEPRILCDPPDVEARSHAAASAVLLCGRMVAQGREAPEELRAMAARVLSEGAALWVPTVTTRQRVPGRGS